MVKTEQATPARQPSSKQNSSAASIKNQSSILGFFSKAASNGTQTAPSGGLKANGLSVSSNGNPKLPSATSKKSTFTKAKAQNVTPVPSSDPVDPSSSQENAVNGEADEVDNGLPSPLTPAKSGVMQNVGANTLGQFSSPSRRVRLILLILEIKLTLLPCRRRNL